MVREETCLNSLDVAFLSLDSACSPMNLGGLGIFAGTGETDTSPTDLALTLIRRISQTKTFHQRLHLPINPLETPR